MSMWLLSKHGKYNCKAQNFHSVHSCESSTASDFSCVAAHYTSVFVQGTSQEPIQWSLHGLLYMSYVSLIPRPHLGCVVWGQGCPNMLEKHKLSTVYTSSWL